MSNALMIVTTLCLLALAQAALAAGPPLARPAPAPAAKLAACEKAWAMQRIRKGTHRAFIRACVRHG